MEDISSDHSTFNSNAEEFTMSSWNLTNASLVIQPTFYTTKRTDSVVVRNLLIGCLGILFNAIAITFLCTTGKVKVPIRVTMIGMALNDLCFTTNACVLGNPIWVWISDAPYCWPVMYFVVAPMLVSNLMTVLLALHNFMAVVYPLHCDMIMTKKRSIAFVTACWVAGYIAAFGCLYSKFPEGLLCFVLIVMPRNGLAVFCGTCLVCSGFIVGLNVIIVNKIRDSAKLLSNNQGSHRKESGCVTKKSSQFSCRGRGDGQRNVHTRQVINVEKNSLNSNNIKLTESNMASCFCTTNGRLVEQAQTRQRNDNSKNSLNEGSFAVKLNTTNTSSKMNLTFKVKEQHANDASNGPKNVSNQRSARRVKTSITLMILTCWSCFLSLPLAVFMIYVALLEPDRQAFTTSFAGFLITFFSVSQAVGNPLLYAWRFINWGIMRRRVSHVDGCW